jgi:N-acetylglucosamine malate deacetylase 1
MMLKKAFMTLCAGVVLAGSAALAQPMAAPLVAELPDVAAEDRVEDWREKTILIFTPHPDDETFSMGGTIARLAANGNNIQIVIYTNDDKGSLDLEMTSERLARIRRAEEEEACRILGVPKENITWLGYGDGNLEYADPHRLRGEAARLIKLHRPDAIFSPDPGVKWVQWHKTDHRMSANITQDAFIASEWHLYYPQHLLDEDLKPFRVPVVYYYYSHEPDYAVNITEQMELKVRASAAHVSQFEPSLSQYTPDMPKAAFDQIDRGFRGANRSGDGYAEHFRRVVNP